MDKLEQDFTTGMALGNANLVQSCLARGVSVNAPVFGHGATALFWAVGHEREDLVRLLLQNGAEVNVEDWEGFSPLRSAIANSQALMVALLLQHGANPLHRSPSGSTPLEEAEQIGHIAIVELLKQAVADR